MSSSKSQIYIDVSKLPQGDDAGFSPTATRPSTAEIEARSEYAGQKRSDDITFLPELRMVVKYSRKVSIAEGQTLWAMKEYLPGAVPVPGIYGWHRDEDNVVILYMELVDGVTLEECWQMIEMEEGKAICEQLKGIFTRATSLFLARNQFESKLSPIGNKPDGSHRIGSIAKPETQLGSAKVKNWRIKMSIRMGR
ncbi:uncharacterized protein DFL_005168 [Arthrobotrys flagrans]|uniref:Aminoglycoside phosphotransferase domain-containing protein n=1 Tax=Arthrobotrys flagrans TaxID=97331 RepID=A0A437A7C4_ARTFL|nr:hypothetical protein DFL_005168 [Arthrobotrys flagrans]